MTTNPASVRTALHLANLRGDLIMSPPSLAFLVSVLNFSSALVVPAAANFAHLQGVSNSYYGSPLCVLIIDCGAANEGTLPSPAVLSLSFFGKHLGASFQSTSRRRSPTSTGTRRSRSTWRPFARRMAFSLVLYSCFSNGLSTWPHSFVRASGCVDTSFVAASGWVMEENVIGGEFGDELEISYSPSQPIDGVFVDFRYSGSLA